MVESRHILITVADKTGLESFAVNLGSYNFNIVSPPGETKGIIHHAGVEVIPVEEFVEIPDTTGMEETDAKDMVAAEVAKRLWTPRRLLAEHRHVTPLDAAYVILKPPSYNPKTEKVGDIGGKLYIKSAIEGERPILTDPAQLNGFLESLESPQAYEDYRQQLEVEASEYLNRYDQATQAVSAVYYKSTQQAVTPDVA